MEHAGVLLLVEKVGAQVFIKNPGVAVVGKSTEILGRTNTNGAAGGVVEGVEFGLCSVKRKAVSRPLDKDEVKHFV